MLDPKGKPKKGKRQRSTNLADETGRQEGRGRALKASKSGLANIWQVIEEALGESNDHPASIISEGRGLSWEKSD